MKKLLILLLLIPVIGFSQNYIGFRTDIMAYKLKSQFGHQYNQGLSYSVFSEFKYKPLISFGVEVGGYNFQMEGNRSTNLYAKPTVILNVTEGRSSLAVFGGVSLEMSVSQKIANPYTTYTFKQEGDTTTHSYTEHAHFERLFQTWLIGASYSYRISDHICLGLRFEGAAIEEGFYKGYNSNFTRLGVFLKYKI